jgi:serine/threonine protein kinase/tetratricopeptide (TPR) repeat protein
MIEQLKSNPSNPVDNRRRSLNEVSSLEQIGDYRIVREIGRGGMGIVFEAVHESLGRRVAIKVMPTPLVNSHKYVERFKRESQAAARLHHTNIVGVFGVGEGEGYHYYVMDIVDGQTLSEVIHGLAQTKDAQSTKKIEATRLDMASIKTSQSETLADFQPDAELPENVAAALSADEMPANNGQQANKFNLKHFRWAARIGANIADALSYAHATNILHRDIKPANIILDRKGVVWITDFGLAKDSSQEINLTKTGDVIGTPQYLAPESLEGVYDGRSEVYCLGLTLYELATLQPAYPSGTTAEVIRAIATSSPVSPRKINPKIPIDLSTIIDKAVARDPRSRYSSAEEMRNDLQAFVEDRPISARPPSTLENVFKWGRRNPLAAGLAAVSGFLLILVAVSASVGFLYTTDALKEVRTQQKETERQRQAAVAASQEAKDFAQKMEDQYARAEANIEITIKAFDEMFKQVVSRGASVTGEVDIDGFEELMGIETSLTREDAEFLEKLLSFYDQFATQNADNESLKNESARAFRRVANIYQLIGEANRSQEAYQKSIRLYEQILDQSPSSKETLIALVQTKNELSRACRTTNAREAFEQYKSAKALLDAVPDDQIDDELRLEKAKTLNSLGSSAAMATVMFNSGSFDRERPGREKQAGERPPGFPPRPNEARPLPGWLEAYLGSLPRGPGGPGPRGPGLDGRGAPGRRPERGGINGAMSGANQSLARLTNYYSTEALNILNALIEKSPNNTEYRWVRANCYCNLAATLLGRDKTRAREMRNLAIAELESLIELDSDNSGYRYRLVMACSLGDPSDSSESEKQLFEKSVQIAEDLKTQCPQVLDYHLLYGSVCTQLAGRQIARGKLDSALDSLKTAKSSFEYVGERSPSDQAYKRTMGVIGSQFHALIAAADAEGKGSIARESRLLMAQIRLRAGTRSFRRPTGQ